jgi:cytochrome c6
VGKIFVITAFTIVFVLGAHSAKAQAAADIYKSKCMMCHGADGSGNTPAGKAMGAIPFSSPALIAATLNGKGKMPAYTGKLTPAQVKDLIAYIRIFQK